MYCRNLGSEHSLCRVMKRSILSKASSVCLVGQLIMQQADRESIDTAQRKSGLDSSKQRNQRQLDILLSHALILFFKESHALIQFSLSFFFKGQSVPPKQDSVREHHTLTFIRRGCGALGALRCWWSDTCSVPRGGMPDAARGFAAPTSTALPPSQVQGVHSVWGSTRSGSRWVP